MSLVMVSSAQAFTLYSSAGSTLSESFDALPTASAITNLNNWVDNTTLPGWYRKWTTDGSSTPDVVLRFRVDDGSASGGSLASYGTLNSTDRALGGLPSSNLPLGWIALQLVNDTNGTLTQLDLSYFGEQWRQGNTGAQAMNFSYGLGNSAIDAGAFQDVDALDFVAIQTAAAGGVALDGNAAANRTNIAASITGISWQPGQSLWLRWAMNDQTPLPGSSGGGDQGLAIDDLQFRAVPEPATWLVLGAGLAMARRRSLKLRR